MKAESYPSTKSIRPEAGELNRNELNHGVPSRNRMKGLSTMLLPIFLAFFLPAAEWTQPIGGQPNRQPHLAALGSEIALTYGAGDAIYFTGSKDAGKTWSKPLTVAEQGKLSLGMRRGPRIAITKDAIVITAITGEKGRGADGDVMSWRSVDHGATWSTPTRVNDVAASAREGLHSLAAGGRNILFATWLDLREKGTKLYGSVSKDGGRTWSPNRLVYQSPSGSVCECCHPTAVVDGDGVIGVMFRNSLDGNRDMYLVRSADGGTTYGPAAKLGSGSWKLNACPMDGGSLVLGPKDSSVSVWRREGTLYLSNGSDEALLGPGRQPVIARTPKGTFVAWTEGKSIRWKDAKDKSANTLDEEGTFLSLVPVPDGGVLIAGERDGTVFVKALQ